MYDEIAALKENNTFEPVELPEGCTEIGGKWVYAVRTDKMVINDLRPDL